MPIDVNVEWMPTLMRGVEVHGSVDVPDLANLEKWDAAYASGHMPAYYIVDVSSVPAKRMIEYCEPIVAPDFLLTTLVADDDAPCATSVHCLTRLRNECEVMPTV